MRQSAIVWMLAPPKASLTAVPSTMLSVMGVRQHRHPQLWHLELMCWVLGATIRAKVTTPKRAAGVIEYLCISITARCFDSQQQSAVDSLLSHVLLIDLECKKALIDESNGKAARRDPLARTGIN